VEEEKSPWIYLQVFETSVDLILTFIVGLYQKPALIIGVWGLGEGRGRAETAVRV